MSAVNAASGGRHRECFGKQTDGATSIDAAPFINPGILK
jgi:hypothetical protein